MEHEAGSEAELLDVDGGADDHAGQDGVGDKVRFTLCHEFPEFVLGLDFGGAVDGEDAVLGVGWWGPGG